MVALDEGIVVCMNDDVNVSVDDNMVVGVYDSTLVEFLWEAFVRSALPDWYISEVLVYNEQLGSLAIVWTSANVEYMLSGWLEELLLLEKRH